MLMVAENARFMAAVRQCKALIERGGVGDLRVAVAWRPCSGPATGAAAGALNGGGVFIDSGIHKVHLR